MPTMTHRRHLSASMIMSGHFLLSSQNTGIGLMINFYQEHVNPHDQFAVAGTTAMDDLELMYQVCESNF